MAVPDEAAAAAAWTAAGFDVKAVPVGVSMIIICRLGWEWTQV